MADKTYVPGVDGSGPSIDNSSSQDFSERRNPMASRNGGGTVIPEGNGSEERSHQRSAVTTKDKPVLGFLYSVSRNSFGEFWPVYLGPNTIGRGGNADIILSEGTVSSEHATIIVHQEDDGEVYAGIKDNGSTHGVKVNGKSTHFDVVGCKNGDIVKIGKSYELLFILVNASELGLKPAENFIEVKQASSKQVDKRIITGPAGPSTTFNHGGPSFPNNRLSNPSSDRTRAIDGNTDVEGGGTRTR
ncbi:MAG: FHA domain-containing protein [Bacteroidales bacterium]|nr:FHA domain-containing protein [Bacteroidales bacterium]